MKTTNKILIAGFIVGLIISTYFILKITSFIQINELIASGFKTIEEVPVESFESISVDKGVVVNLSYGEQESLKILADTAFTKYLIVDVEESILKIHLSKKLPDSLKIVADLVAKDLKSITVSNKAKVISNQRLSTDSLKVEGNSSGKIDINVELKYLECDLRSHSELNISGISQSINVKASHSAKLNGENLKTTVAEVKAENNGFVHFYVSGSIDVKAIDGGIVEYIGDPQVKNMEVNDGGKLIKL